MRTRYNYYRGYGSATHGERGVRHGPADYYAQGDWNARCWTCFKKIKASEALKLSVYDGNCYVCRSCFELPNPQQFVRGIPDRQNVPWTQPTPPPIFVGAGATSTFPPNQVPESDNNMIGGPMIGANMMG